MRSRLGEPRRATAAAQPNAHDSATTDTVVEWTFDRVRFQFLVVAGRDLLVEARARSDDPTLGPLFAQFRTLDATLGSLGQPGWTTTIGDTTVYGYRVWHPGVGPSSNEINFYFVGDRLVSVGAVPFVD